MAGAGATPLLPDEIVIWEILVRLPPKSLLRCRSICRAWRSATSTRSFLLAHHGHQPNLPIISGGSNFLAFDHRAADDHLHTVARLDQVLHLQASCDGLLVLSRYGMTDTRISICNPATREHAPLVAAWDLNIMGMYPHQPTGEYRLLLHRGTQTRWAFAAEDQIGCYIFTLGSGQPPRYIESSETAPRRFNLPVLLRDNLHWYPSLYQVGAKPVIVFDTIAETFRQMRAPIALGSSYIFEMDGTLGVYSRDLATKIVRVWVLQSYEGEVWDLKYRIKLPVAEIRARFEGFNSYWNTDVVSRDGGVLLVVSFGPWMLHVDSHGKLVDSFHRGGQGYCLNGFRLKQTLVQHTFFTTLEGYAVNALPFV
uniref:Uncharacterized protein n=3 Tax=Avena sativa TaxID=4498 RepID=A0ACD5XDW9_AVESA